MGFLDFLGGGGDSAVSQVQIPSFFQDKYYKKTQERLYGVGNDFLAGKGPSSFYDSLVTSGGADLENLINMMNRDVTNSAESDAIRRNASRGGSVTSAVSKAVGDVSTKLRWEDYLRSQEGKKLFLGAGLDTISGVRSAGLTNQAQRNQFNLSQTGLQFQQAQAADSNTGLFGQLLQAGLSTAGTAAGAYFGGPAGASIGGSLGSSVGASLSGRTAPSGASLSQYDIDRLSTSFPHLFGSN